VNSDLKFLYRGESKEMYEKNSGQLIPRGNEFTHVFTPSDHLHPSKSIFVGECEQNAVVTHQSGELMAEQRFQSAGISTTPIFERARFYATHNRDLKTTDGWVFIINRNRLAEFGIEEKIVSDLVEFPSIPEDREVILVAKDRGTLPKEIIVQVLEVTA